MRALRHFGLVFCLTSLLWPAWAHAQRPRAEQPADRDAVIEVLPRGYATLMPQASSDDGDPAPPPRSVAAASALIATAARSGDARLIARAERILEAHRGARQTPAALRASAYAAQYRHAFGEALALLDRAVARDPRDVDARLSRAQILLVRGDIGRARQECTALAVGIDVDRGLLCVAAVEMRRGRHADAARLLDHWLARGDREGDAARHALVMRAETASRAGEPTADAHFQRALAIDPRDVRTLAAYARHLREHDRAADAERLLTGVPASDHLLLERALAAHAAGSENATALAAALARRFATTRRLGMEPDLRDEAEYWLSLRGDAARALPLARANFDDQRDVEDVEMLRRAAAAANAPQAWAPVVTWAASEKLPLAPVRQEGG